VLALERVVHGRRHGCGPRRAGETGFVDGDKDDRGKDARSYLNLFALATPVGLWTPEPDPARHTGHIRAVRFAKGLIQNTFFDPNLQVNGHNGRNGRKSLHHAGQAPGRDQAVHEHAGFSTTKGASLSRVGAR
jgi:hypothetical protein